MNIAIIEKHHFEVAYTLLSVFDNGKNDITIFIDQKSYQQLESMLQDKMKRYIWVTEQRDESNRQFIHRIFQLLKRKSFDLIYFDTIENNYIHYAYYIQQLKAKKTVLTLHDINGFFQYKTSLNLRRLVRYAGKKWLIHQMNTFNVLSETLANHLSSKLPAYKKIFNIPGSCFEQGHYIPLSYTPGETLKIAIPGAVDKRRRDYDLVFDLLHAAQQRNLKISVTLLGTFSKGNSENILKRCKDYLETKDNLNIYQSSIVNQPEFDKVIQESHFIWMPLQQYKNIADGITEQYGISTCSGNIADVIKHAKSFFSPAYMAVDSAMLNSCIKYYSVNELADFLKNLTTDSYHALQKIAYQTSLHYTKENIIRRNAELFGKADILTSKP